MRPTLPLVLVAALLAAPASVLAVGNEDDEPPPTTQTTTECTDGMIWDETAGACVAPQESRLDDDTLYQAAREFAYAGQYDHALGALDAMSDPREDRVLTYKGFAYRKSGDRARGMDYYRQALAANPDNLLARSYMGMAHVEAGETVAAQAQLAEIRARGGAGTWPETALAAAIASGSGYGD